jgi:KinB signaling pathway activation protein
LTSVSGLFIHVYWYTGMIEGGFLATTSLMGFWAYLTLNFVARITLPRRVWRWMQMLILALVLYDMFYVRYHIEHLRHVNVSYTPYLIQAAWPLGVALIGAFAKRKLSGKGSFLPSLFFLYVFTVVDWLLVIWYKNGAIVNQTGLIMMACNVYLLLIYGKLLSRTPDITDIQVKTAKTS